MSAADRRVHVRLPLRQVGVVQVRGFPPLPCTIRDFCLGGMFIGLSDNALGTLSSPQRRLARETPLAVDFSVNVAGQSHAHRLTAKVARVVEHGIGVSFVNPDPRAMQALQWRVSRAQDAPAGPGAPLAGQPDPEARRLVDAVRDVYGVRLHGMLVPFFEAVYGELTEAANTRSTFLSQSHFFDARAALTRSTESVKQAFASGAVADLEGLVESEEEGGAEAPSTPSFSLDSLELVDQSEFEDMLATSELATRAEDRFRQALLELQRRFAAVLPMQLDVSACPIGPAVLADAFRMAVTGLGLHRDALDVLYRTFERTVVNGLGTLYDAVNGHLDQSGFRPLPPPRPVVVPHVTPPRPDKAPSPPAPAPDGSDPGPAAAGSAPRADGPRPGGSVRQGPWQQTRPPERGPTEGPDAVAGPPDAVQVAQALLDLVRAGTPPPGGPGDAGKGDSMPALSRARTAGWSEVLEGLSALQLRELQAGAEEEDGGVRTQLLRELTRRDASGSPVTLGPQQAGVFDVLGRVLGSVSEDLLLADTVKQRIQRLGNALHRVALRDTSFLERPDHPARRVLDNLAELETRRGHDAPVWASVDPLLDRIARDLGREPESFEGVAQVLDGMVEEARARYAVNVEQVVQGCEHQREILKARRASSSAAAPPRSTPPELADWVAQAQRLRPGDQLELWAGTPRAKRSTLAWISDDQTSFAFVDGRGEKAASLSLQEVAMELRRGLARPVEEPDGPLMQRALDRVMESAHRQLHQRAQRDGTSGFYTARTFEQALGSAMEDANRRRVSHALCRVDIDRFQSLVDAYGPAAGDACLATAAEAIEEVLPPAATAGRVGANSFGILLPNTTVEEAVAAAESIRQAVGERRVDWQGSPVAVTASVGVAELAPDGGHPRDALRAAESACRVAQDSGGDRIHQHSFEDTLVTQHEQMVTALGYLQKALNEGQVGIRGQPIVPIGLDASLVPHWEVLLELRDENGQMVPAAQVVGAAEHYGHASRLDRLVIRQTLQWMADHPEEAERAGGLAINLSGQTLADDDLASYVVDQLMQTRVPPGRVLFEVTETAAVARMSSAQQFIRTLQEFGCRFCLDDFGSGHVSFAYLRTLPVEYVKIDGQFVRDIHENPHDYAVVKSINEVAHVMGKRTIAEYVHSLEVLEKLKELGVDYAQGYWVGKPRTLDETELYERTMPLSAVYKSLGDELTLSLASMGSRP
jgi:diguanylate cyclase (GGDEF)-like protein